MALVRVSMTMELGEELTITSRRRHGKVSRDSNLLINLRRSREHKRKFRNGSCKVCNLDKLLVLYKVVILVEAVVQISIHRTKTPSLLTIEYHANSAVESSMNKHIRDMCLTVNKSTKLI